MNWEARLEDARRRRAIALAAKAAFRDEAPEPAPTKTRPAADPPPLSGLRLDGEHDHLPPLPLRRKLATGRTERTEATGRTERTEATAPITRAEPKPEPVTRKTLRMPTLAFPVREHAADALLRLRSTGIAAHAALSRVGPVPLASGAVAVGVVFGLGLYFLREVPPQPLETLSVSRLEAPAVAAAPDWTKPGPAPIDSLPLDLAKLAIPEAPELGLALLPEPDGSGVVLTLLASAEASVMPADAASPSADTGASVAEDTTEQVIALNAAADGAAALAVSEAQAQAAPSGALVRVFVPSDLGPDVADIARAWVEADGDRVDAVREVPFRVSATHVRFYHDADRAEAERIAEVAGGEARDFTGAEQLPGLGYLELYVAGEGRPEDSATRTGTGNTMFAGVNSALTAADQEIVRIIEDLFD